MLNCDCYIAVLKLFNYVHKRTQALLRMLSIKCVTNHIYIYLIYMYTQDLVLNNLHGSYAIKPSQTYCPLKDISLPLEPCWWNLEYTDSILCHEVRQPPPSYNGVLKIWRMLSTPSLLLLPSFGKKAKAQLVYQNFFTCPNNTHHMKIRSEKLELLVNLTLCLWSGLITLIVISDL